MGSDTAVQRDEDSVGYAYFVRGNTFALVHRQQVKHFDAFTSECRAFTTNYICFVLVFLMGISVIT